MLTPEREKEIREWDGDLYSKDLLDEIDQLRAQLRGKPPVNIQASQTIPRLFDEIDRLNEIIDSLLERLRFQKKISSACPK